jgi:hypothetical protein
MCLLAELRGWALGLLLPFGWRAKRAGRFDHVYPK